MAEVLEIQAFLSRAHQHPVIDVRSPLEFNKGHIPGAFNIPLLNDEVRVQVGTAYKKKGHHAAVKLAFELCGGDFYKMIKEAELICKGQDKTILVHCWRGGLRSNTMAWMLSLSGFRVYLLKGGYKVFRNWALAQFDKPKKVVILGGRTGSGKTDILKVLAERGEQVIDLEGVAHHKGSAFGSLGQPAQPSNEHFENQLALICNALDPERLVWVENESRQVGSNIVPAALFERMRAASTIQLNVSREDRMTRILEEYGKFPAEQLAEKTLLLSKRLGIQKANEAVSLLRDDNVPMWLEIVLDYYDKNYDYGMSQRSGANVFLVPAPNGNAEENATLVLDFIKEYGNEIVKNV